jgi:hypothetical protein
MQPRTPAGHPGGLVRHQLRIPGDNPQKRGSGGAGTASDARSHSLHGTPHAAPASAAARIGETGMVALSSSKQARSACCGEMCLQAPGRVRLDVWLLSTAASASAVYPHRRRHRHRRLFASLGEQRMLAAPRMPCTGNSRDRALAPETAEFLLFPATSAVSSARRRQLPRRLPRSTAEAMPPASPGCRLSRRSLPSRIRLDI